MNEKSWQTFSSSLSDDIPYTSAYTMEARHLLANLPPNSRIQSYLEKGKMRRAYSNRSGLALRGTHKADDDEETDIEDEMQVSINGLPYPKPTVETAQSRNPAIPELDASASQPDHDSILSIDAPSMSQTSVNSISDSVDSAVIHEFVELLYSDAALLSLATEAVGVTSIGMTRMRINFHRLLHHCAKDIKAEIDSTKHKGLPGFMHKYASMISSGLFEKIKRPLPSMNPTGTNLTMNCLPRVETSKQDAMTSSRQKVVLFLREQRRDNEVEDSDDNGDILEVGGDEEDKYDGSLRELLQFRVFLLNSTAFHALRLRLYRFVRPSMTSDLQSMLCSWQKPGSTRAHLDVMHGLANLVAELQNVPVTQIHIENDDYGTTLGAFAMDTVKAKIEDITGTKWDWWSLQPCKRPLREREATVMWRCVSFTVTWCDDLFIWRFDCYRNSPP